MKLTDITVRTLPLPEQGQRSYADDALAGFGVRVSQGGAKSFFVQITGANRERITIGKYPVVSLADARNEAKRILAEKTLGKHRPKAVAFDTAKSEFIEEKEEKNRANTVRDYKRLLKRFPFGKTRLADISRQDVKKKLDKITAPSERKHALVAIKTFFRWCIGAGYLDNSPCEAMKAPQPRAKQKRVLAPAELREVLSKAKIEPYPFGPIVLLLVLTGQRRTEIAHLEWEWIDRVGRTITLPASLTKNKREHTFPYGDMVATLLDTLPIIGNGQYLFPASREHVRGKPTTVFNGWGKAKAAFDDKLADVAPWTLHDLRRTFSTRMAELGIRQLHVEKLLNHISGGEQSAIAQVYNQYDYMPEMRDAVQKYEAHLQSLLSAEKVDP